MERLDKLLAATGKWSRKEAKALIKAGRVRVEDRLPKGPEDKVEEGSLVTVDGKPIFTEKYVYLMLHKPAGVISATQDAKEKTVLDLLPKDLRPDAEQGPNWQLPLYTDEELAALGFTWQEELFPPCVDYAG